MSTMTMTRIENSVILASAGTGKTFQLSNRFLDLLNRGNRIETILATTFTRKGAGEILDRVVQRLAKAAASPEGAAKLSDDLTSNDQTAGAISQTRANELLVAMMRELHRLNIGTMDSYFNRVAQSFSLEIGLPHEWSIVPQHQMELLVDEAISAVLQQHDIDDLLHKMNKGETPTSVAGEIRNLVNDLYACYRGATPSAWDSVPEFGRRLSDAQLRQAAAFLRTAAEDEGAGLKKSMLKDADLVEAKQWATLFGRTLVQRSLSVEPLAYRGRQVRPEIEDQYRQLSQHLSAVLCQWLRQGQQAMHNILKRYAQKYEQLKSETGRLRFDDITHRLAEFVQDHADVPRYVAYRMDHQIQHLLLDEFQDTSLDQWHVIRPYAEKTTDGRPDHSFFCVGDVKQSIYGWRGGVPELLPQLPNILSHMSEAPSLVRSYRSAQPVIDVVNDVFGNLSNRYTEHGSCAIAKATARWDNLWEAHKTAKTQCAGWVTVDRCPTPAKGDDKNEPVFRRTIERIKQAVASTESFGGTVGVLVRKNDHVAELIYRLKREGIEASEEGGSSLTDSAAVNLILDLLKLADHPRDTVALYALSHSPLAGYLELEPMNSTSSPNVRGQAHQIAWQLRREWLALGPGAMIEKYARVMVGETTQRERTRLQQLIQEAYRYHPEMKDPDVRLRPSVFRSYIIDEFKASDPEPCRVRVMTVHQSKGLEFDVVVLPLGAAGSWTSPAPKYLMSRQSADAPYSFICERLSEDKLAFVPTSLQDNLTNAESHMIQEQLCVLYVAMTRAAHALHIVLNHQAKPETKSGQGVICATLAGKNGSALDKKNVTGQVLSCGDENWFQHPGKEAAAARDADLSDYYLPDEASIDIRRIQTESRLGRDANLVGPSSLEGGEWVALSGVFRNAGRDQTLLRGTLIHACFEQLTWLEDGQPAQEILMRELARLAPGHTDLHTTIDEFRQFVQGEHAQIVLDQLKYRQTILPKMVDPRRTPTDAIRLELQRELRVAVPVDERILNGTIDRLVLVYEGEELIAADVIDYKTDSIADDSALNDAISYYRPQINAYRQAIATMMNLVAEQVHGRLLFVASDRLAEVV